ncbi:GL16317 [Drosophila persimilis]|uniref:Proliferation-associated protein 2G4 n=2 Tax=pseudoobscura subgroup TaxID=32358 RepID=Q2LZA8_DROPS|nr:proliferation-associated protein 2G4 [Drosophila pseudoobscura]XP_002027807.1 proliferation-associated protein 2G4 [Drosophila persimilis]XP_017137442.1 proliferation-associated protein 2G4 [Drosophila miranda]EDW37526.1 GL16317 [Drosophila persimilis]
MADAEKEPEKTIAEDLVVTKYKLAGEIVNKTLKAVIGLCVADASVREICTQGDNLLTEETGKVYKKEKDLKKGIAFPTCLSVNNCVCHFSPAKNDTDYTLKAGDVVKIDLGAHIDGFIAVAAHTISVGASADQKISGRPADVILAAYWSVQAALRLLKSGANNYAITDAVQQISESYKCKPIEGMLSHELKQFKIDGEKTIIQNPSEAQRKEHEKCTFDTYEVYAIDVIVSSGEGVGREKDTKVSIYKKSEENYMLKLKASRALLAEVKTKYGNMPFNIRSFEEETKARMGVVECVSHKMIEPFQVLYEKPTEIVAQFKHTILLMPNGVNLVTGIPFNVDSFASEYSIAQEELKTLVAQPLGPVKGKGKGKKASAAATKVDSAPAPVEAKA